MTDPDRSGPAPVEGGLGPDDMGSSLGRNEGLGVVPPPKLIRVYWSRRTTNVGDWLTHYIWNAFGIAHEWAPPSRADCFGIGSLAGRVPEQPWHGYYWTTGFMNGRKRVRVHSTAPALWLRGPLSARRITQTTGRAVSIILGDGGLLTRDAHQRLGPPGEEIDRCRLTLVPHYRDRGYVGTLPVASARGVRVVDVLGPTASVIEQIRRSAFVLSSSLHGLVIADSFGVPNRRMVVETSKAISGGGFKFRDYYANFGHDASAFRVTDKTDLRACIAACDDYSRPGLARIVARLRESLEYLGAKAT